MSRPILLFVLALLLGFCVVAASVGSGDTVPALSKANVFDESLFDHRRPLSDYRMSEKLDGVRAYWDGDHLISRQGNRLTTPPAFTRDFPDTPLDGELWMGRGTFSRLVGLTNRHRPDPDAWEAVYYMVFDLPRHPGTFDERRAELETLLRQAEAPRIRLVEHRPVESRDTLMARLEEVVEAGGEGLMLNRGSAPYRPYRSNDLLKLKPYRDAEARVVAHLPGEGRLEGKMGALLLKTPGGRHFKLGTGFSDAERDNPPPIGSLVTYKYHGLTSGGLPRFASFLRLRERGSGQIR